VNVELIIEILLDYTLLITVGDLYGLEWNSNCEIIISVLSYLRWLVASHSGALLKSKSFRQISVKLNNDPTMTS